MILHIIGNGFDLAHKIASVIAILMTAMINANPISMDVPKMSFHHIYFSDFTLFHASSSIQQTKF